LSDKIDPVGEKEHADLSCRSERSHLVLVCTERRRPRPLLQENRQRGCPPPAAQMGVAKSDFLRLVGADQILIENAEGFARISLDLSGFGKERNHCKVSSRCMPLFAFSVHYLVWTTFVGRVAYFGYWNWRLNRLHFSGTGFWYVCHATSGTGFVWYQIPALIRTLV